MAVKRYVAHFNNGSEIEIEAYDDAMALEDALTHADYFCIEVDWIMNKEEWQVCPNAEEN